MLVIFLNYLNRIYFVDGKLRCEVVINNFRLFLARKSTKNLAFEVCRKQSATVAIFNKKWISYFMDMNSNNPLCVDSFYYLVNTNNNKYHDPEKLQVFYKFKEITIQVKQFKIYKKFPVICNITSYSTTTFHSKSEDSIKKHYKYLAYLFLSIFGILLGVTAKQCSVCIVYI